MEGLNLLIIEQLLVALEDIANKRRGAKSVVNMSIAGQFNPQVAARQCMWKSYSQPFCSHSEFS
jgi:hypothetical protein